MRSPQIIYGVGYYYYTLRHIIVITVRQRKRFHHVTLIFFLFIRTANDCAKRYHVHCVLHRSYRRRAFVSKELPSGLSSRRSGVNADNNKNDRTPGFFYLYFLFRFQRRRGRFGQTQCIFSRYRSSTHVNTRTKTRTKVSF